MERTKMLADVVSELNASIYEREKEEELRFTFLTDGYVELIDFDHYVLYCSENEGFLSQSEVKKLVKKEFNKYAEKLSKLKFK